MMADGQIDLVTRGVPEMKKGLNSALLALIRCAATDRNLQTLQFACSGIEFVLTA